MPPATIRAIALCPLMATPEGSLTFTASSQTSRLDGDHVIGVSLVIGQDLVNVVRAGDDHRLLRRGFTSKPHRLASAAS